MLPLSFAKRVRACSVKWVLDSKIKKIQGVQATLNAFWGRILHDLGEHVLNVLPSMEKATKKDRLYGTHIMRSHCFCGKVLHMYASFLAWPTDNPALQRTAMHCYALQCTATHCDTL